MPGWPVSTTLSIMSFANRLLWYSGRGMNASVSLDLACVREYHEIERRVYAKQEITLETVEALNPVEVTAIRYFVAQEYSA